jgi:putative solute:sodium symporter small subunit
LRRCNGHDEARRSGSRRLEFRCKGAPPVDKISAHEELWGNVTVIEIGIGLLLVLGASVILTGAGDTLGLEAVDVFPLIGYGGIGFIAALGVLFIAAGLTRRAMQRHHARRYALRSARLTWVGVLLTAFLAIGVPLCAAPFNLVSVGGFPLGYYAAAQGALIGLVVLAFAWAGRRNRIDAEEPAHE